MSQFCGNFESSFGKIITGDCVQVMPELPDKCVDYAFTSPPYNREKNDKYEYFRDVNPDYHKLLTDSITELLRITRKHVFFNVQATYYNKDVVYKIIGDWAEKIQQLIIWEKTNPQPSSNNSVTNSYEFFIVLGDTPVKGKYSYTRNIVTTGVNSMFFSEKHKAVMNYDVAEWVFDCFIPDGSTVIDPFMGFGTTAIVAEKHGCPWVGIKIRPEYVAMAEARIQKESGSRNLKFDFA